MPALTQTEPTTLVNIYAGLEGTGYKLSMYPKRKRDTTVFFTRPGEKMSVEKPREVVWIAHGLDQLPAGVRIDINRKYPGPPLLSNGDSYTLTNTNPRADSGSAKQLPPNEDEATWGYKVELFDASGNRLAWIDPDVIVKEDP